MKWNSFSYVLAFLAPILTVFFLGPGGILINILLLTFGLMVVIQSDPNYKELAPSLFIGCFFAIPISIVSCYLWLPMGAWALLKFLPI